MGEMPAKRAWRWKQVCAVLGACLLFYFLLFNFRTGLIRDRRVGRLQVPAGQMRRPSQRTLNSLTLDEDTCDATFPGLTKGIDDEVALGPFQLKQARDMGPLQARLKDGQLYIIHMEDRDIMSRGLLDSRMATLHQIYRAVLTSPAPLPDTIISVNVQDGPISSAWSYSRPAYPPTAPGNPNITRAFLMPHFSFWAWPLHFIGSFSRAAAAIDAIEAALPFSRKDPRAVWRGTKRYNSAHNPHLREDLLRTAGVGGAAWADVQELRWEEVGAGADRQNRATNSLMAEDFCRYRYAVHTEGITYSGRLQLLQMCASVLLTPPMAWMQHTTHLVRPLFSSDLELGGKARWAPTDGEQRAWPTHYGPDEANIVFVAPDWSDLEDTVRWMEEHPDVAEGIARRQRELFVDGGYFSPAAEACYWRALIRGWSKVVRTEREGWEQQHGMRWELFAMGYDKDVVPTK